MSADELKLEPNLIQEFLKWHSQSKKLSSFRSGSPGTSSVNSPPVRDSTSPTSSPTHPPSPQAGVSAIPLTTGTNLATQLATGAKSGAAQATGAKSGAIQATGAKLGAPQATGANSGTAQATGANSGTAQATGANSDAAQATGANSGAAQAAVGTSALGFTADDYLSKGKKFSEAKKRFRHILKQAALEAKVWGARKTLKDLTPAQRKHIHDRVISECPALQGHSRDIDIVLAKALSENKYYMSKCSSKKAVASKQVSTSPKKKTHKKGLAHKLKPKESEGGEIVTTKSDKQNKVKKGRKVDEATATNMSQYEFAVQARRKVNKALLDVVKEADDSGTCSSGNCQSGENVTIHYHDQCLATGTFIAYTNEMYCRVGFEAHLLDDPLEDLELPEVVPADLESNRRAKTFFAELEKDDIFTWKVERVKRNVSTRGYIRGVVEPKDIFTDTIVQGRREPRRNRRYDD